MKKLLFLALIFCTTTFADSWKVTVGTNSTVIAPTANVGELVIPSVNYPATIALTGSLTNTVLNQTYSTDSSINGYAVYSSDTNSVIYYDSTMWLIGTNYVSTNAFYTNLTVSVTPPTTGWVGVTDTNALTATATYTSPMVWEASVAVSAGDYVFAGDNAYWTPNGGTMGTDTLVTTNDWNIGHTIPTLVTNYTAMPTHYRGIIEEDDGIIWKRVVKGGRNYLILYADTATDVLYDIGVPATTDSGGRLGVLFPKQTLPTSDHISARVESTGTATIRILEL